MRRVLLSGLIDAITGITAALLSDHRNIYRYAWAQLFAYAAVWTSQCTLSMTAGTLQGPYIT